MYFYMCIRIVFFMVAFTLGSRSFAQHNDPSSTPADADHPSPRKKSKVLTGFYVGSFFANKYSASNYNGYGFDIDGNRNTFLNGFMHQKIINEYGGGYGQFDQIAQALNVDQGRWVFSESDMPTNMRYVPAIMVGLNFKIPVMKMSSIIFNVNASKLNVEGNFTINLLRPLGTVNPGTNPNLLTFPIKGSEQRLNFQLGFQHVFGDPDDPFGFLVEAGFIGTLAKFNTNTIYINNLTIDLTYYVNQTINPAPNPTRRPIGFGIGAFAGLGFNIEMNPKFTLQLLYSPTQEKVNFGTAPTLKLQNGVGLRVYYKI
jgi:hypothetical protein